MESKMALPRPSLSYAPRIEQSSLQAVRRIRIGAWRPKSFGASVFPCYFPPVASSKHLSDFASYSFARSFQAEQFIFHISGSILCHILQSRNLFRCQINQASLSASKGITGIATSTQTGLPDLSTPFKPISGAVR